MSVPPPALVDVGAPRRAVHALDREVLVVAEHDGHRPAVPTRRHRVGERGEHRRVAQHEPDLVRATRAAASAIVRHSSIVGASGFSQKTARSRATAARTASAWPAVQVQIHATSTSSSAASSDSCGGRVVMAGGLHRPLVVGVVGRGDARVDEPGVGELAQRVRVHRPDVTATDQRDAQHVTPLRPTTAPAASAGSSSGPQRLPRRSVRTRPSVAWTRRDRPRRRRTAPAPRRACARARRRVAAPRHRRRTAAGACTATASSSCSAVTPSSRIPSRRSTASSSVARRGADRGREIGRRRAGCGRG